MGMGVGLEVGIGVGARAGFGAVRACGPRVGRRAAGALQNSLWTSALNTAFYLGVRNFGKRSDFLSIENCFLRTDLRFVARNWRHGSAGALGHTIAVKPEATTAARLTRGLRVEVRPSENMRRCPCRFDGGPGISDSAWTADVGDLDAGAIGGQ